MWIADFACTAVGLHLGGDARRDGAAAGGADLGPCHFRVETEAVTQLGAALLFMVGKWRTSSNKSGVPVALKHTTGHSGEGQKANAPASTAARCGSFT
ncbi:MAG: hypothetical protein R3F03_05020 [Opitutaceae bacterium]